MSDEWKAYWDISRLPLDNTKISRNVPYPGKWYKLEEVKREVRLEGGLEECCDGDFIPKHHPRQSEQECTTHRPKESPPVVPHGKVGRCYLYTEQHSCVSVCVCVCVCVRGCVCNSDGSFSIKTMPLHTHRINPCNYKQPKAKVACFISQQNM